MAKEFYEYVWDITFLIPNRDISFKPYSLVEFTKNCDYFNNFIPSYTMTCKIQDQYLDYFRYYDKEVFVRIKQFMFKGASIDNKTDREMIFEDTFALYIDKSQIPSVSQMTRKTSTQKIDNGIVGNTYENNTISDQVPIKLKFNLLLRSDLMMKTFIHNYIFGSEDNPISPITAAVACINMNPHVKKFLIDKPDNTDTYTDLIVEPGELKQVLYNIQRKYGIYAQGMSLFFDSGTLYVLNKLAPTHTKSKDEAGVISIRVSQRQDKVNVDESADVDKQGNIYYSRPSPMFKSDTESIEGILNGDMFVFSNYGSVINSVFAKDGDTKFISPLDQVEKPRDSRKDVGVKKIIDYDMLNNPYNMSSFMYEKSIGVPIGFVLTSVNVKHFAPNMSLKVGFDNPESNKLYSGIYNIQNANFTFTTLNRPNARFRTYGNVSLMLYNKHDGYDKGYSVKKPD